MGSIFCSVKLTQMPASYHYCKFCSVSIRSNRRDGRCHFVLISEIVSRIYNQLKKSIAFLNSFIYVCGNCRIINYFYCRRKSSSLNIVPCNTTSKLIIFNLPNLTGKFEQSGYVGVLTQI